MENTLNVLQKHTLLYQSLFQIDQVMDVSETEITYLAHSFSNGEKVVIKEFFPKDCMRKIDGSVGSLWISDEAFKHQISVFVEKAQQLVSAQKALHVFEENGTAYYITLYQETTSAKQSNSQNQQEIVKKVTPMEVESIITPQESLITNDESIIQNTVEMLSQSQELILTFENMDDESEKTSTDTQVQELEGWTDTKNKEIQAEINFLEENLEKNNQDISPSNENQTKVKKPQKKNTDSEQNYQYQKETYTTQKAFQDFEALQNKSSYQKPIQKQTSTYKAKKSSSKTWLWVVIALLGGYMYFVNFPENQGKLSDSSDPVDTPPRKKAIYATKGDFSEGLAWAYYSGKYGFINEKEEEVIPFEYQGVRSFKEGRAWVKKNGKIGFIDSTNQVIIPLEYDGARDFSNKRAWVMKNELIGYVDWNGKQITECKYLQGFDFVEGMAYVGNKQKWGFIDSTGKEIVPFKYDGVRSFNEDMAWVSLNSKYGFINKEGVEVVLIKYDGARDFSDGLAWVKKDNLIGFVNKEGKEVIPPRYVGAYDFNDGFAGVLIDSKVGFIDKQGNIIIAPQFDDIKQGFKNGKAKVLLGVDSFYIDKQGQRIEYSKGVGDKINQTDKTSTDNSSQYERIGVYYKGVLRVRKNNKFGLIDESGKEIIPLKYDFIGGFVEDFACVRIGKNWGYLNTKGIEILPCIYQTTFYFSDGMGRIMQGNKYGYINREGRVVIAPIYTSASSFSEGLAKVQLNFRKFGYIDKTGKIVIPLIYQKANVFRDGKTSVTLNGKTFYIDKTGKCIENCPN